MVKKILVTIVLVVLVLDTAGCFRVMTTRKRTVAEIEGRDSANRIVAVQTREDQRIEFKKKSYGEIVEDRIVGTTLQDIEISQADVQSSQISNRGAIQQVKTRDGSSYTFVNERHDAGKISGRAYAPIRIAISEVRAVWVKEVNTLATIAAYVIPLAILGTICAAVLFRGMLKGFLGAAAQTFPQ
jgi:hypothetical protein